MGVRLLERTSRRVELTAAGGVFLDESRRLLRDLDAAVHRTQRAARPARLILAVRPGTGSGLLAQVLRSHDGTEPELVFTHAGGGALRDGTAAVARLTREVVAVPVADLPMTTSALGRLPFRERGLSACACPGRR
ncbi:hypothetical protein ACIO1C_00460 [Streptomyces sp. NPDC087420]|uniref:hypothetical protein n=1 Tax=Streptomyces sp. NPDC087420 TaxID=3365785 RepID=UPI0038376397